MSKQKRSLFTTLACSVHLELAEKVWNHVDEKGITVNKFLKDLISSYMHMLEKKGNKK